MDTFTCANEAGHQDYIGYRVHVLALHFGRIAPRCVPTRGRHAHPASLAD